MGRIGCSAMGNHRKPKKTIVDFCEDFWSNFKKLPRPILLLSLPILLLYTILCIWGSLGGRARAYFVFWGSIIGLLAAFLG
jgi:hypothetical protein